MANRDDILKYIPQRQPMVMVDEMLYADGHSCRTAFTIREDNILLENGTLGASGMIENIAQTAAARIGYVCLAESRPVPIGYLGAVQNIEILGFPKINERIETEISIKNQIFDVTIISGTIRGQAGELARCTLKIFINKPA